MVFFNYSTMQMAAKIVYYGPGLCGKTTNLQHIYQQTATESRGEMVSLETETDRTLFFDLLPIDVGKIGGFATRIQLYTVPGQVFYNTTRKLVLKGVDGVVFVADSQKAMLQANADSLANLEENLKEMGLSIDEIPLVLQYNKRDLPSICDVQTLDETLNQRGWPRFEASAIQGQGVFETLRGISKITLVALKKRLAQDAGDRLRPAKGDVQAKSVAVPDSPPAKAPAPTAAQSPKGGKAPKRLDALAELEKLRKSTGRAAAQSTGRPVVSKVSAEPMPASPEAAKNGHPPEAGELTQEIRMSVGRNDFSRLRRLSLSFQVQDEDHRVVDEVKDFHVDLDDPGELEKLRLRLSISLSPKG